MYARVFASILDSSLNTQAVPLEARWLWLTMILIADEDGTGVVDMPLERLAARACLSIEETRRSLDVLLAPDPDSRSDEHEGRRLLQIRDNPNRGWELVNWAKFRDIGDKAHQREATRQRVARHRDKARNTDVTKSNAADSATDSTPSPNQTQGHGSPEAPKSATKKFIPPTEAETLQFFEAQGVNGNHHLRFLAYYTSNGWKVGKNPIKRWKAAAAGWILRGRDNGEISA